MTSSFPRTLLAIGVAMTLTACGGNVAPTGGPAAVDQTPPPSSTTAPPPSAILPSLAPSAAASPSLDASGSARNGVIAYSDGAGDIYSLDPATGATTLLVGGPETDVGPAFLPDGQHLIFYRIEEDMVYLANADGTGARIFGTGKDLGPGDWSPGSDRLAAVPEGGGDLTIIDVASGRREVYALTRPAWAVQWLTEDVLLLIEEAEGSATALWTINVDGTNQQAIETPFVCCGTSTIRGRGLVAWTSWDAAGGGEARIHVVDTASGQDRLLASTDVPGFLFLDPIWSPDGKWLTVKRVQSGDFVFQLALIAADGSGTPMDLGPRQPTTGAIFVVALDGGPARPIVDTTYCTWSAAWAPIGEMIAFGPREDGVHFIVNADGSDRRDLAPDEVASVAWSPDGKHLVVARGPAGSRDLWITDLEGTFLTQLTHEPGTYTVYDWR